MLKKLLFVCLTLWAVGANAQFTVESHAGDPILDGDVVAFNEVGAELPFYVYNTSSSNINMKIEFVSTGNGDPSMMELCFGLCYTGITVGHSYPGNQTGITIVPGQHQDSTGDHFLNTDPGNGSEVLDYVFNFYQVDDSGHPIGASLTMTYRYDPNLGVDEVSKLNVTMYPKVVKNFLTIEAEESLEMNVYNLQGRLVKSEALSVGENQVEMSDLASQIYLVRFTNESGEFQTSKVIVE